MGLQVFNFWLIFRVQCLGLLGFGERALPHPGLTLNPIKYFRDERGPNLRLSEVWVLTGDKVDTAISIAMSCYVASVVVVL